MNLQVVSPYRKCPYACPYCVAAYKVDCPFSNTEVFYVDKPLYFHRLRHIIRRYNISTVVLTGDTEPTIFPEWIAEVTRILRQSTDVTIELQTKNCWYDNSNKIDVVAFSYDRVPVSLPTTYFALKRRAVFILSDTLELDALIKLRNKYPDVQFTMKQMQFSAFGVEAIDEYVNKHRVPEDSLSSVKLLCAHNNIRFDENCMDAQDRYLIFRTNAYLYDGWDKTTHLDF